MSFVGYAELEEDFICVYLARDPARTPINLDALPTIRVYGPDGLLPQATTSGTKLDSGVITDATNADPIVITSTDHGLTTGTFITVEDVGGNTDANGTFIVTRLTDDTFSLDGSEGSGAYTSGGVWNVTGLYEYTLMATAANGFEVGVSYKALIQGTVAGNQSSGLQVFVVV